MKIYKTPMNKVTIRTRTKETIMKKTITPKQLKGEKYTTFHYEGKQQ
tara:strand:- start:75 stop:215 length:141 start_codon:yes stop_codon:yes gene_type:complete